MNSTDSYNTASTAGIKNRKDPVEPKMLDVPPAFAFEPPKDPPHTNVRVDRPNFLPGKGPAQQMDFNLPLPPPPPYVPMERKRDKLDNDKDMDGESDGASTLTGYSTRVPTAPPMDLKEKEQEGPKDENPGALSHLAFSNPNKTFAIEVT